MGEVASCEREGEISDTQTQDSHDQQYRWVEGGLGDNGEFYCYETCNTGKKKKTTMLDPLITSRSTS